MVNTMPGFQHILFPIDFSPQANAAVPYVAAFARQFGAKVTLLCVVPPIWAGRGPQPEYAADLEISTKARLDRALTVEVQGLRVERVVRSGEPAEQIAAFARESKADLIMMPTHGYGVFRGALIGSVTAKVLHDASCPVWTAAHVAEHAEGQRARYRPQKIICSVDGSGASVAEIRWAVDLGGVIGAAVQVLHVTPPVSDWAALMGDGELQEQERKAAEARVDALRMEALGGRVAEVPLTVLTGPIADSVAELASAENADLLIIGRGRIGAMLGRLRTHAYGIIRQSPCPVISV
jgi:nucleotide-binding universal stress UspA family protein